MSILDYQHTVDFGHDMTARGEDRARRLRIADTSYMLTSTIGPARAAASMLINIIGDGGVDAATIRAIAKVAQDHADIAAQLNACLSANAPARQLQAVE